MTYAERGQNREFDDSPAPVDSRCNTYENAGFPPGPIGAVSQAAIDAAATPQRSPE